MIEKTSYLVYFRGHLILPEWYLDKLDKKTALKQAKDHLEFMVKNDELFTFYEVETIE